MRVTVVGTGRMGSAMVRRLCQADITVDIWSRSADKAEALASETGAVLHSSVESAVASADFILSCLASGAVTQELLLAQPVMTAVPSEAILCDMGTSGIEAARQLRDGYGDRFVDSPVSGSVPAVLGGTLLVMASGSEASVSRAVEPLSSFAKGVVYLGPAGNGQRMKLALNLVVHALNSAIAEGLGLATESGIPLDRAYQVLRESSVTSPYVVYKEAAFLSADDPVAMSLDLVSKDVTLIQDMAEQHHLDLRVLRAVGEEVDAARESGFGSADMADLLPYLLGAEVPQRP